jgi:hypothetical protein
VPDVPEPADTPEFRHVAPPFPIPHVTWHGGTPDFGPGWVQITLDCDRGHLEQILKDLPADQSYVEIHSEVLARDDVNRLIKHARRARNAAYGADE